MGFVRQTHELTVDRVRELFDYEQASGRLLWRVKPNPNMRNSIIGRPAGNLHKGGHRVVMIEGAGYTVARLVWAHQKGEWPPTRLKALNGDFADSRIENLALDSILGESFKFDAEGRAAYGRAHREARPYAHKERDLRKKFGIGVAEFMAMSEKQGGECAICHKPETRTRNGRVRHLAVDHNHDTGALRELLCADCNVMIGMAKEDEGVLVSAIHYLRKHKAPTNIVPFPPRKDSTAPAEMARAS